MKAAVILLTFGALATRALSAQGQVTIQTRSAQAEAAVAPGSPGPRVAPLMIYNSAQAQLVIYGGHVASRAPGADPRDADPRTFAWNDTAWRVIAETGPRSRDEVAFAVDTRNGSILMFGGRGNGEQLPADARGLRMRERVAFRETWVYDGRRWTLVDTLGPAGRSGPQGAFDAARGRFVVFGGALDSAGRRGPLATETWEWDGRRWTRFDVPGPRGRTGHVMAYDASAKRVILHGGVVSAERLALTDTWAWDGRRWKLLTAEGPRAIFGAATTAPNGGVVLFGGHTLNGASDSTWHWTGSTWRVIATRGPAARTFNALATDTRRKRIYLYGGSSERGGGNLTDLWYLDARNSWVQLLPAK